MRAFRLFRLFGKMGQLKRIVTAVALSILGLIRLIIAIVLGLLGQTTGLALLKNLGLLVGAGLVTILTVSNVGLTSQARQGG
jgi:hypothetical protein